MVHHHCKEATLDRMEPPWILLQAASTGEHIYSFDFCRAYCLYLYVQCHYNKTYEERPPEARKHTSKAIWMNLGQI
jgi:hypothetical protein